MLFIPGPNIISCIRSIAFLNIVQLFRKTHTNELYIKFVFTREVIKFDKIVFTFSLFIKKSYIEKRLAKNQNSFPFNGENKLLWIKVFPSIYGHFYNYCNNDDNGINYKIRLTIILFINVFNKYKNRHLFFIPQIVRVNFIIFLQKKCIQS